MAKKAATKKPKDAGPAIVVVGDGPAAAVAALKLRQLKADVALADPGTLPLGDRLVAVNPAFFDLLPILATVRKTLAATPVKAVRFHGADGAIADTTTAFAKDAAPIVARLDELRDALRAQLEPAGVTRLQGRPIATAVDERGVTLSVGRSTLTPRLVVASDPLDDASASVLATNRPAGREVLAVLACPPPPEPTRAHAALDLGVGGRAGEAWGTFVACGDAGQISVYAPLDQATDVLRGFVERLAAAGVLAAGAGVDGRSVRTMRVPLAGALQADPVARHTLLVGPAGGFVTATGDDVYPGAWSAVYAATAAAKAAKADHVQDALAAYRSSWGGTLGEYLQGPRQNMRFLLPLVFKNPVMTDRVADALFRGKSLVR